MDTSTVHDPEKRKTPPLPVVPQDHDRPIELRTLQETIEQLQRDLREARGREEERDGREQARLRDLRRSTRYVPSFGTPAPVVTVNDM